MFKGFSTEKGVTDEQKTNPERTSHVILLIFRTGLTFTYQQKQSCCLLYLNCSQRIHSRAVSTGKNLHKLLLSQSPHRSSTVGIAAEDVQLKNLIQHRKPVHDPVEEFLHSLTPSGLTQLWVSGEWSLLGLSVFRLITGLPLSLIWHRSLKKHELKICEKSRCKIEVNFLFYKKNCWSVLSWIKYFN